MGKFFFLSFSFPLVVVLTVEVSNGSARRITEGTKMSSINLNFFKI